MKDKVASAASRLGGLKIWGRFDGAPKPVAKQKTVRSAKPLAILIAKMHGVVVV